MIAAYLPEPVKKHLRNTFVETYYKKYRMKPLIQRRFQTSVGTMELSIPERADQWYNKIHEPKLGSELSDTLSPETVFFDIGSQYGYFIEFALQAGVPPANTHGFELDSVRYSNLESQYSEIGVNLENKRVCNHTNGEAISIDEYSSGEDPPDVIKIDVEGGEAEVVSGMKKTLSSESPIVYIEMHPSMLSDLGYSKNHIYDIFEEHDYSLMVTNHRKKDARWVTTGQEAKVQSEKGDTYLLRATP